MEAKEKDMIEMAARFVNSTASHIFLTGKAGTGKTTFLRDLAKSTHKKYAIVAPTGIAALNAGGSTIHSMFQLPLGTFLPDRSPSGDFSVDSSVYTEYTLGKKHHISSMRKQVLRELDILIIDEVSMLRADILDAIDYRMRSARGNHHKSFGGAQILLIGDLFQLPPIVRDHEWSFLRRYYHSIHFFEAKSLLSDGFIYIELDKIFRQSDEKFIHLLNNFRNNVPTREDIDVLNSHFKTPSELREYKDVITVTTHNNLADQLNRDALLTLQTPAFTYDAEIEDEFPENIYPLPERLTLKVGAQVMFVKNDTSGANKYYNGRLAEVISLGTDYVEVLMRDPEEEFKLVKEEWENKRYTINETSRELDEVVIGTFRQYPIKLAWAITVHKSQGLTFDKAIIDVGYAFASGQVYVALSRLRSLEGLVLRTRIDQAVVPSDQEVVKFSQRKDLQSDLEKVLREQQRVFVQRQLETVFDFSALVKQIRYAAGDHASNGEITAPGMKPVLMQLLENLESETSNAYKFRYQLNSILVSRDEQKLLERLNSGSMYYRKFFLGLLKTLLIHAEHIKLQKRQKGYLADLAEVDQMIMKKLEDIDKVTYVVSCVLGNLDIEKKSTVLPDRLSLLEEARLEAKNLPAIEPGSKPGKSKTGKSKTGTAKKGSKRIVGQSQEETLVMFESGKTIEEIAGLRKLAIGTIESHLLEHIRTKKLDALKVISTMEFEEISSVLGEGDVEGAQDKITATAAKHGYFKLRAVRVHMNL